MSKISRARRLLPATGAPYFTLALRASLRTRQICHGPPLPSRIQHVAAYATDPAAVPTASDQAPWPENARVRVTVPIVAARTTGAAVSFLNFKSRRSRASGTAPSEVATTEIPRTWTRGSTSGRLKSSAIQGAAR